MKTRTVKPCGFLYTANEDAWILIHPYPIVKDSWQGDNVYRFVCVPGYAVHSSETNTPVYDYARHIVSNNFTIEYIADIQEIEIKVLEDIDVIETELHDVNEEEVKNILQENDYGI